MMSGSLFVSLLCDPKPILDAASPILPLVAAAHSSLQHQCALDAQADHLILMQRWLRVPIPQLCDDMVLNERQ
jgi:hypothetical protein